MRDLNGNALLNNIRYNPNGERIFTQSRAILGNSTPLNTSTRTGYDLSGHTISQSSYTGNALQPSQIQETVWLGDTPVLILDSKPQQAATGNNQNISINYIHTDPLNTPRVITDQSGAIIWRWESDPYGVNPPTNAAGTANSSYTYNLRFAGQVYDAETKLHYNYYRDYDPATGRYIESDPIGLAAGVNTYAYVGGNPIRFIDPKGLAICTYNIGSHMLECTSRTLGKVRIENNIFSGQGSCKNNASETCQIQSRKGPIPEGEYRISPHESKPHFYRLKNMLMPPENKGFCLFMRCHFELHPGSISEGCVTIDKNNLDAMKFYGKIEKILADPDSDFMIVMP